MIDHSIYVEEGYDNREHYLTCLADDYGISLNTVHQLAMLLGENEDFDGLVSALDDASYLD